MGPAGGPRILLCPDAPSGGEDVRALLERAGFAVQRQETEAGQAPDLTPYDLIIVEGSRGNGEALGLCRGLHSHLGDRFVPILLVTGDPSPPARLAGLEAGAAAYLLRPFAPEELLFQVRTFLGLKERQDRLAEKTAEIHRINQRLQRTYQQLDQELELARRIQRSFLPQTLPDLPSLRFAVHYRPCGQVGGDFYDVFRLDENHLGFYVADAMGHGVPASLLTIFVKKGIRPKEIFGKEYRLVPADEVLLRLNRELLAEALAEHPFITMAYVLFNHLDGTLQFARAGHPYPLHVPRVGEPELWQVEGSLLGVFETVYPMQSRRLEPGDKLLLYTDGVDGGSYGGQPAGARSLLACAAEYRHLPIGEFVERLAQDLFREGRQEDDLTFLGVERRAGDEAGGAK